MEDGKSKRKPNWTDQEMVVLAEAVASKLPIIKGKFSLSISNSAKARCWDGITQRVNAVNVGAMRSTTEVKKKWQDVQCIVKKKEAQRLKAVRLTGGGPAPEDLRPWEKVVLDTISKEMVEGVPGGVDTSEDNESLPEDRLNRTHQTVFASVPTESAATCMHVPNNTQEAGEDVFSVPPTAKVGRKRKQNNYLSDEDSCPEKTLLDLEREKHRCTELYRRKKLKIMEEMLAMQERTTVALEQISATIATSSENSPYSLSLSPVIKL